MAGALLLLLLLAQILVVVWAMAGVVLDLHPDYEPVRAVFYELRPFFLPAIVASAAIALWAQVPLWMQAVDLACNVALWVRFRNSGGPDDRWKRRGRKVADKVAKVGARLIVVPAGGAS